ncbi:MAG: hypothetical protein M0Z41_16615 [Peptococcaceae bacterium]|jgi:hypothetical protein|nr:hypothetical protein [Peptococcaceae bacterium]
MVAGKLGKKPATYDRRDLQFIRYRIAPLPPHPAQFGHENLIGTWGMLGNDIVGDCVFAGADHETMLWTTEGGDPARFSAETAIADYSAVTGYNPADPSTDRGTDVRQALQYRQQTGLVDVAGARHRIGAYLALELGNTGYLLEAMYLLGAVGIGIQVPRSALDQFDAGQPWSVVQGNQEIVGGHYVPLVAYRDNLVCVTWGALQPMTLQFYAKYCDEAWAILSPEMLKGGRSLEGFDLSQLQADMAAL